MEEEKKQSDNGLCPATEEKLSPETCRTDVTDLDKVYSNTFTKAELISRLPAHSPGRKKDTPAKIIEKKAVKQLVAEYKRDLADALPRISPVLIKKAERGDLGAIKEINEVLIDKSKNKPSGGDTINNLILVKFIDGKTDDNRDTTGV